MSDPVTGQERYDIAWTIRPEDTCQDCLAESDGSIDGYLAAVVRNHPHTEPTPATGQEQWLSEIERIRQEHNAAVANGLIQRARTLARVHDAMLRKPPTQEAVSATAQEREQSPMISADKVERIFDAWCQELVRRHGDRTVAAVLSSPAVQAMFTGDVGQTATELSP